MQVLTSSSHEELARYFVGREIFGIKNPANCIGKVLEASDFYKNIVLVV